MSETDLKVIFQKALRAHNQHQLSEAINGYEQVLILNPVHLDSLYNLGLIYQIQRNFNRAQDYFDQILALDENYVEALFSSGSLKQQQKQYEEAQSYYAKVLKLQPEHDRSFYNLGTIAQEAEKPIQAVDYYKQCLSINPLFEKAYTPLIHLLLQQWKVELALDYCQNALQHFPEYSGYLNLLGKLYYQVGQNHLAEQAYLKACQKFPSQAEAFNNLGVLYLEEKQFSPALQNFSRALDLQPDSGVVYCNLGNLAFKQERYKEARICYERALMLQPDYGFSYLGLGNCERECLAFDWAEHNYQNFLKCQSAIPELYLNWGLLYLKQKLYEKAEAYFKLALDLNENYLPALNNLAIVKIHQQQSLQALSYYQRCYALQPETIEWLANIAWLYFKQGLVEKALDYYQKALTANPHSAQLFSNLVYCLRAQSDYSEQAIFSFASRWKDLMESLPAKPYQNAPDPERPLRIGYVSADFCQHSAASVFKLIYQNHDERQFKLYSYAHLYQEDQWTKMFEFLSDEWRPIQNLNDQQVAALIRKDQIDILVDLSSHTAHNRLTVFDFKSAPVQITGLGYGCTTGLKTIDYRIADPYVVPPGFTQFNSEKILYISSYLRWVPPTQEIPLEPPPVLSNQYITFGCGNALFKLNQRVLKVWSRILNALPSAKLYLKDSQFNEEVSREKTLEIFLKYGVESERIIFLGGTPHREHMEFNNQIDIALDPFPYNGGISTCETLWMGVPVVTLAEGTRSGVSLLSVIGLSDLIAWSEDEYIQQSIALAKNMKQLKLYRKTLRQTIESSIICNGRHFACEVENAYRTAWRMWCRKQTI